MTDIKALSIRRIIQKHNIQLAVLTETNVKLNKPLEGRGKPMMVTGESNFNSGVAIVFEGNKMKGPHITKPRLLEITLPNDIHVIGAYGPTEQATQFEKLIFWNEIRHSLHTSVKTHHATIFIGDLNAGHEPQIRNKNPKDETNHQRMLTAIDGLNLTILETAPTWKSGKSTHPTRTLDRCLIHSTSPYIAETTINWEDSISDHAILVARIKFNDIDRNIGRPYSLTDNGNLEDIDIEWNKTKNKLKMLTNQTAPQVTNNLTEFWEAWKEEKMNEREPLTIIDIDGNELNPQEAVEACATYLRTVWNRADPYEINFTANNEQSEPPNEEEVANAVDELKTETALGRDKIPTGLVKRNNVAIQEYTTFFRTLWKTPTKIPREWKDMKIKPIPKTNPRTLPIGARPVTCLATSTKILNRILATRNEKRYEDALHTDLHAYRKHRSAWTAISALISEIKRYKNCFVTFLDMSKAFDCVSRKALEAALHRWNIPANEARILISQYTDCNVYVELNGFTAKPFLHTNGIRQGCTLSGVIWNLVTSQIHFNLEAIFPTRNHAVLSYADDIIIVTAKRTEGQILKRILQVELAKVGLTLNDAKEVVKQFNIEGDDTESIEWLGARISGNLTWDTEVTERVDKATKASKKVRKMCRNKSIKIPTKLMINILRSLAGTHLTCGTNVIAFNEDQRKMMLNCMAECILDNTNIQAATADKIAEKIMNDDQINEDDLSLQTTDHDPTSQQSLDNNTTDHCQTTAENDINPTSSTHNIGNTSKQSTKNKQPTQEETLRRQKLVRDLQEERKWCRVCNPPVKYGDITSKNNHRKKKHGLEPEGPLKILCKTCERQLDSSGFSRHICIDQRSKVIKQPLIPCQFCGKSFSKFGVKNHMVKCFARQTPP